MVIRGAGVRCFVRLACNLVVEAEEPWGFGLPEPEEGASRGSHGSLKEIEVPLLLAGAEDDLSELLQHEIDHLDGILAVDRMVSPRTLCSREEFEERHRAGSPYASAGGEGRGP